MQKSPKSSEVSRRAMRRLESLRTCSHIDMEIVKKERAILVTTQDNPTNTSLIRNQLQSVSGCHETHNLTQEKEYGKITLSFQT